MKAIFANFGRRTNVDRKDPSFEVASKTPLGTPSKEAPAFTQSMLPWTPQLAPLETSLQQHRARTAIVRSPPTPQRCAYGSTECMVCKALRISPQCQHSPQAASSGRHQRCFCQVEASISIGTSAIELQDAALPTTRSRCRQPRPAEEDVNDQQAERSKAGLIFPCRPWPCQRQSGLPSRLGVRPKRKVRGPPTRRCAFHVVCRLGGPARRARCCQTPMVFSPTTSIERCDRRCSTACSRPTSISCLRLRIVISAVRPARPRSGQASTKPSEWICSSRAQLIRSSRGQPRRLDARPGRATGLFHSQWPKCDVFESATRLELPQKSVGATKTHNHNGPSSGVSTRV